MRTTITIARNTFCETTRQPVFAVILAFASFLIASSPSFAMYTFMDSTKLVQDMGLATIMLAGLFLAVFGAATAISREIDNKTALTVLSKPVCRESFLLGKFLGIIGMTSLAVGILTIILMFAYRFGVKDTASTILDWGVAFSTAGMIFLAVFCGFLANFFFNRPFVTVVVKLVALFLVLNTLVYSFLDDDYHFTSFGGGLNWQIAIAGFMVLLSIWMLSAIAVAVSTRLNAVGTLVVCAMAFFGGLVSQYYLGGLIGNSFLAWVAYHVIPNMQVFWIAESMTIGKTIPYEVVASAGVYAMVYIGAVICAGMLLLVRREVS